MKKFLASFCSKLVLSAAVATTLATTALVPGIAHAAPEEVTYLLPAPPNSPAFAPWVLAQHKGYYADENLKINFIVAKGGVDVAKQIGAGNAVIGGAIGDTPIVVRANGIPVKAIAVLGAGSITMVAANANENIKSLKDLKGKTVTVMSYTDTTYYAFLGSLRTAGLSKTDVQIQAAGPAGVWQVFTAGKASAFAGVPDWIVNSTDAGAKVELLDNGGFKSMAQAILASDDTIKNPKAAANDYVAALPAYKGKEASIEATFEMYRKYVYANQKVLGQIDAARMDSVQKFYVSEAS